MRDLSTHQAIVAIASLTGLTILGMTGHVSGDAIVAVFSAVAGGALGYVNGKKASK
jgi:hypothetical protein